MLVATSVVCFTCHMDTRRAVLDVTSLSKLRYGLLSPTRAGHTSMINVKLELYEESYAVRNM